LADSADPDQSLDYLERFARAGGSKVALFSYLKTSPAAVHLLTTVFGASPFLSQILIRNPEYLHWLTQAEVLRRGRTRAELERDLRRSLVPLQSKERRLDALRRFKRREILVLGVRDLLTFSSVEQTTLALSILSEVLIQEAYRVCHKFLSERYGLSQSGFTILGMGKLGGSELNFSSDVDLVYVCGSDRGTTTGTRRGGTRSRLSHSAYFRRLAQDVTNALSEVTDEGYLFRVDLRLRPEGGAGELVGSLQQYRRYYRGSTLSRSPHPPTIAYARPESAKTDSLPKGRAPSHLHPPAPSAPRRAPSRAQTWERLAQIKARPIAGDKSLGRRFMAMVQPFIYQPSRTSPPKVLRDEVRRIKRLIDEKMMRRGESQRNVKLGIGGIREIELVVQALQAIFGHARPTIRERNTIRALDKLRRARLLTVEEYGVLLEGYRLLRNIEHKLQMVEEQQTHTLPTDPIELRRCALRLGYRDSEEGKATERFLRDQALCTERVHEIFVRTIARGGPVA
jgi:[glutamine synthetase] adenylyltransferase / [glutamine synthetase]-adenylyl-L-tyrosine phosphorylase